MARMAATLRPVRDTLTLTRHATRASFSEAAESFLLEAEAENGLMLGLLGALPEQAEVGHVRACNQ